MAIKVIIQGSWSDCVGTDYCDALGIYDSLEDARGDAEDYAWSVWEPQDQEGDFGDEGPDFYIEEYDPKKHDMLKAGVGSFKREFEDME